MDFVSLGKVLLYSSLLENFPSSFCLSEGSQSRDSQIFIFTKTSAPYFYQNVGNSAFVKNSQLLNLARVVLVLYPQKKVSASSFLKNTYNSLLGKIPIYNIHLCKCSQFYVYFYIEGQLGQVQHCLESMRRIYSSIRKENVYIAGKQKRKMHRANFTPCLFATVERFSDFLWSKGR